MSRHRTDPSTSSTPPLRIALLALAAIVALTSLPVVAQSADPTASAPQTTEKKAEEPKPAEGQATAEPPQGQVSEEIVVTARKREENVQEVPIAVSVLPAAILEDTAAADISEVQSQVPNLAIYAGRNQSTTLTVFLRGIGQADPLWGVDPGVGLYLDDVYLARPQGALLDVYDVGRIEVLRGPQGTLYGKNTIGGAIKYVSNEIGEKPQGQVSLTPGSYNNRDAKAMFSTGFAGGKVRAKLAVASLQHDGYGKNLLTGKDVSDKDTKALRFGLDFLPSDNVKLAFSFDHTKDDAQPKGLTKLAANPFCAILFHGTCPVENHIFDTHSGLAPVNGTTGSGYAATLSWKLSEAWRFKSISAYRKSDSKNNIDFDTTPFPIADVIATYFDKQTSEELQMVYDAGGRVSGVFGAYYFHGKAGGLVKNNFFNAVFGTTNGDMVTDSIALYGDGSYKLTDQLVLDLGLRATQEKKHAKAFNAGYSDATFTHVTSVVANFDKEKTFNSLAPKLGLDYHFSPTLMGYVTASRGFKSGGYNVRAQARVFPKSAEPFDDEILDMGELGLKSTLADGSLMLNLETFYGKYKDIQVSTFTAYDSNGDGVDDAFFGNFLNAGNATLKGAELEFDYNPPSWFGVSGNLAYLDAKPDEFLNANPCVSPGKPTGCDNFVDTQVITNAPKWTGALRANFKFAAARGSLISGSIGWAYRDDSVLTNEGGARPGTGGLVPLLPITQDAYGLWDAWIGWLSPSGAWRFGISGKNLTDEEYKTNGYNIPALGVLVGSYGAPRTVLATVEYRFH